MRNYRKYSVIFLLTFIFFLVTRNLAFAQEEEWQIINYIPQNITGSWFKINRNFIPFNMDEYMVISDNSMKFSIGLFFPIIDREYYDINEISKNKFKNEYRIIIKSYDDVLRIYEYRAYYLDIINSRKIIISYGVAETNGAPRATNLYSAHFLLPKELQVVER